MLSQVYSTGITNTHLNISTVAMWILNAVVYAVVFCLLWFNVVYPTFESYSLYEMGTTIYVGLVLSMHLKVAFIHHLWNQIHLWSMIISVGGLFLFLYILNSMQNDNYDIYYVVNKIYSLNLFWFFGTFSIPLFCVLIDVIGYCSYFMFAPTREMLYREAEQKDARVTAEDTYRKTVEGDGISRDDEKTSSHRDKGIDISASAPAENGWDSSGTASGFQMTSIYQHQQASFVSSGP